MKRSYRLRYIAAFLTASLILTAGGTAVAMDSCTGSYSATRLRPLAPAPHLGLDLSDSSDMTARLAQAFTKGMQDAGVTVGGTPNVLLRLTYQIIGQGGSVPGGDVQNPAGDPNTDWSSWSGGQAAALQGGVTLALPDIPNIDMFNPQRGTQSGLLMLRVEARDGDTGTPAWIAVLQCTIKTTDSIELARQLGYLLGGVLGKEVHKAPV